MLKKIRCALLCAAALFSVTAVAGTHELVAGVTLDYEFLPGDEPQLFFNRTLWPIEGNCKIQTEDESDELRVIGLSKMVKVNGIELLPGNTLVVTVHSGDILKLYAESRARVEITNLGKHSVNASCST